METRVKGRTQGGLHTGLPLDGESRGEAATSSGRRRAEEATLRFPGQIQRPRATSGHGPLPSTVKSKLHLLPGVREPQRSNLPSSPWRRARKTEGAEMSLGPTEPPSPTHISGGYTEPAWRKTHPLQEAGSTNPRTKADKMAREGSKLDPGQAPPTDGGRGHVLLRITDNSSKVSFSNTSSLRHRSERRSFLSHVERGTHGDTLSLPSTLPLTQKPSGPEHNLGSRSRVRPSIPCHDQLQTPWGRAPARLPEASALPALWVTAQGLPPLGSPQTAPRHPRLLSTRHPETPSSLLGLTGCGVCAQAPSLALVRAKEQLLPDSEMPLPPAHRAGFTKGVLGSQSRLAKHGEHKTAPGATHPGWGPLSRAIASSALPSGEPRDGQVSGGTGHHHPCGCISGEPRQRGVTSPTSMRGQGKDMGSDTPSCSPLEGVEGFMPCSRFTTNGKKENSESGSFLSMEECPSGRKETQGKDTGRGEAATAT